MTLAYDTASTALPAIVEVMERLGVKMTYAKDEEIFAQDEDADLVHLVVSGAARTLRFSADGRRQVGAFYFPGDLIGLELGGVHRYTAEALCETTVLVVRRSALKTFAGDAQLDRAIWEATHRELERAQEHLMVLGRKTAREKVAGFLMERACPQGSAASLPMSRQDMADYLGLTIETVSRTLTQLQGESVVAFDSARSYRVTRWQALERMAA